MRRPGDPCRCGHQRSEHNQTYNAHWCSHPGCLCRWFSRAWWRRAPKPPAPAGNQAPVRAALSGGRQPLAPGYLNLGQFRTYTRYVTDVADGCPDPADPCMALKSSRERGVDVIPCAAHTWDHNDWETRVRL